MRLHAVYYTEILGDEDRPDYYHISNTTNVRLAQIYACLYNESFWIPAFVYLTAKEVEHCDV